MSLTNSNPAQEQVIFQEFGNLGLITLNRPEALNALSLEMVVNMRLQLEKWAKTPKIKGVAIMAAGERAFCAGGDIRSVWQMSQQSHQAAINFFHEEYRLNHLIHSYPKPYIALIDGIWMGGGVGVSLHGSCRVVSEKAIFAMPEASIGFIPDVGTNYYLARLPSQIGKLLALTGLRLNAGDAIGLKLAQCYVPSKQMPELLEWLKTSVNWKKPLHHQIKHQWYEMPPEPSRFNTLLKRKIRSLFAEDSIDKIIYALETSIWEEPKIWLEMINRNSPTSLALSLAIQALAKDLDFSQSLNLEFHVALNLTASDADMVEGVRAMIIDKDKQPKWKPASIDQLNIAQLKDYLSLVPDYHLHERA